MLKKGARPLTFPDNRRFPTFTQRTMYNLQECTERLFERLSTGL